MTMQQAPSAASLEAALGEIIMDASAFKDPDTVMMRRAMKKTLPRGKGRAYTEVRLDTFSAHRLGSGQDPQELSRPHLTPTTAVPSMIFTVHAFEWDAEWRPQVPITGKFGMQSKQAMNRLADEDGLVIFETLPKTFGAAGTSLNFGLLDAARTSIMTVRDKGGGTTIYGMFTPNQLHDLRKNLSGTGNLNSAQFGERTSGMTVDIMHKGEISGNVAGINVIPTENLYPNTNDDVIGGVFGNESIWFVEGRAPWGDTDKIQRGGGTNLFYMYHQYVFHVPYPSKNWAVRLLADSTAPTS